ncbi:MAG: FAD-dependent oxidoreductase [Myxococcota bacterium]
MQPTFDLGDIRSTYDTVVIGAGPAGCATAAAFARRGANVLLVESNPKAARRFAGEWVHPEGAKILRNLGLLDGLEHGAAGRGFVVFPNDGLGPITLEYGTGERGLSCEHATLVTHLRTRVRQMKGVDYLEGVRASEVRGRFVTLTQKSKSRVVSAPLVVIATGRSARKILGDGAVSDKVSISVMAGLVVRDTELPFEEYGHVITGGPGPALAYRIGQNAVRMCIDVPHDTRGNTKSQDWIWKSYAEVLPPALREGVRQGAADASIGWAANTFRPRRYQTDRGVALVGDAAGVFHPLTAMGITMSLLDAEALAEARSLGAYATRRAAESYVPELLSNAIYQAFAREDASAIAIRDSIFSTWRASSMQRNRTMDLLGATTTSRVDFVRAFSRVALRAGAGVLLSDAATARELAGWLRWPWAGVHPRQSLMRQRSVSWAAPESWARPDGQVEAFEEEKHVS